MGDLETPECLLAYELVTDLTQPLTLYTLTLCNHLSPTDCMHDILGCRGAEAGTWACAYIGHTACTGSCVESSWVPVLMAEGHIEGHG